MLTRPAQPYALLVLDNIAQKGLDILEEQCRAYMGSLKDAHAILVRSTKVDTDNYGADLLAIARAGVGYDNITVDKATERGIPVFFAPGANANSVKELVFASLGIAARNLHRSQLFLQGIDTELPNNEIDKLVEAGKKKFSGFELLGKKFGVIGLGNIGRLVAKTALALGMEVVAYDPHLTLEQWEESVDPGVKRVGGIFQLFKRANIVSVHVTSTDETRNLINDGNMADMHDGTILINMSREPVCNEKDVLAMLESGKLAAFITDFPTQQTLRHPKVLCTPHLGASTAQAEERSALMACSALNNYLKYGVVSNAANFPDMTVMPRAGFPMRLTIPHRNVPGQLQVIIDTVTKAGANIGPQHNDVKNGIGYCVVDLQQPIDESQMQRIRSQKNILGVRTFRF